jgi:endogenous inhibitor of DNA gyrase (YacG/DUF329 family)
MTEHLCPSCRKLPPSADKRIWPFCCERCKERDLANWATGKYAIPTEPVSDAQLGSDEIDEPEE